MIWSSSKQRLGNLSVSREAPMKSLSWTVPEGVDRLEIAEVLRDLFHPHELQIDRKDGYARQIERLTELVVSAEKGEWMPLDVIKSNAVKFGPHYGLRVKIGRFEVKGYVNRRGICFVFGDAVEEDIVNQVRLACSKIDGATEDNLDLSDG